jgi:hypothetical protein
MLLYVILQVELAIGSVSGDAARLPLRLFRLYAETHEALDHLASRRKRGLRAPAIDEDLPRGRETLVDAHVENDLDSHTPR